METRFWLIRHAIVAENERARLYGISDVQLCPDSLVAQAPMYRALASLLPRPALWGCTPLSRTRRTAEAIFAGGYPAQPLLVEPGLIEQNLGEFQGLEHASVPARLTVPAHPVLGRSARPRCRRAARAWLRCWCASAARWSGWRAATPGGTWCS